MDIEKYVNQLIGERLTLKEFSNKLPNIHVVGPGDIVTMDIRTNNSRFFADVDENGIVIGGHFS